MIKKKARRLTFVYRETCIGITGKQEKEGQAFSGNTGEESSMAKK